MSKNWKTIKTIRLDSINEKDEVRCLIRDNEIVIQKNSEPVDVTTECTAELVESMHSSGYYCAIKHKGKTIAALGVDSFSAHLIKNAKYYLVKSPGAIVSFRVMKN